MNNRAVLTNNICAINRILELGGAEYRLGVESSFDSWRIYRFPRNDPYIRVEFSPRGTIREIISWCETFYSGLAWGVELPDRID